MRPPPPSRRRTVGTLVVLAALGLTLLVLPAPCAGAAPRAVCAMRPMAGTMQTAATRHDRNGCGGLGAPMRCCGGGGTPAPAERDLAGPPAHPWTAAASPLRAGDVANGAAPPPARCAGTPALAARAAPLYTLHAALLI